MRYSLFLYLITALLLGCAKPKTSPEIHSNLSPAGATGAGCEIRFPNVDACVSWVWEQKPTEENPGTLVFRIYKQESIDGFPVVVDPGKTVALQLWMPSMGHGSTPTTVELLSIGTYRVTNVFFIMPGVWEIRFQLKDGDQTFDEAVVSLSI